MAGRSSADRLSSGEYKYPVWQLALGLGKRIIKIVLIAAFLGMLVYGAVVITVARYVYIYDNGYVLTMDPKTDNLKKGTNVVFDSAATADTPSHLDSIGGKLELATLPPTSISVGVIEAGPVGKMTFDDKLNVSIDGRKTGLQLEEKPDWEDQYLKDRYIITCVVGDCKSGKSYLMPTTSIDGVVNDKVKVPVLDDSTANKDIQGEQ